MIDPFEVVGERVRHWAEINNPKDGKGTYVPSKSKMRIQTQELVFGEVLPGAIIPRGVYHTDWENNTSVQNVQTFLVEETTTDTYTWSLTAGLKVSSKFTAKIPFGSGTENTVEMSTSVTETETQSTARRWSYSTQVFVPPHCKLVSSFIVNEAQYHVPFTAKVTVRGYVYIKFSNGKYFGKEIDVLIKDLGWSPSTFMVHTTGELDAVVGESFTVRTDEYALDGTQRAMGEVLDRGYWVEGRAISAPGLGLLETELETR
ncbi:ETX/MTX2 family pore-forming toxin [Paracoccus sp. MBLB3053]|uniref:ETX/MTX2 family pore-forming toxin n=1 Tax=Paracoccus aurantius TaxID=3073814 RepID=A0ABU2HXP4_9RHOB|nr:ETX/MTX2 family pore-forming toxin [Paracoccus sp. MBLB3053]MDS9469791.1 ETX/MTX2 family pore-forming toxin [Paracoccus sp. MBLB3053]